MENIVLSNESKDEFNKWLLNWIKINIAFENENPNNEDVLHFYKFPFTMQFSVYQDFLITKGIHIGLDLRTDLRTDFNSDKVERNYTVKSGLGAFWGYEKTNKLRVLRLKSINKGFEIYEELTKRN
jgi:hypothetical protein